jgi:hypothetical protein
MARFAFTDKVSYDSHGLRVVVRFPLHLAERVAMSNDKLGFSIESRGLKIAEFKRTREAPRWGMAASGYTLASGAPTSVMLRLAGEKRWRRLMVVQFSNVGTCHIRYRGERLIVWSYLLPDLSEIPVAA